MLLTISLDQWSTRGPASIGWGLLAALFAGALPLAFLRLGVRRGRWTDHHVDERSARKVPLAVALVSVLAGLAILVFSDAPRDLVALIVAMGAGLACVLAVSHWWKISIHSAVAGGTLVILGIQFEVVGICAGVVLASLAAWSRAALDKHTSAQVAVGLAVGAVAASAVYTIFR